MRATRSIGRRIRGAARELTRWPAGSQEVARRNAMVASTALTQRRSELLEVEEFLARHQQRATREGHRTSRIG